MEKYIVPNSYDIGHWVGVVAFTFVLWSLCAFIKSKVVK